MEIFLLNFLSVCIDHLLYGFYVSSETKPETLDTKVFVYLSQVISLSQYSTRSSHISRSPHIALPESNVCSECEIETYNSFIVYSKFTATHRGIPIENVSDSKKKVSHKVNDDASCTIVHHNKSLLYSTLVRLSCSWPK